jgi:RNA polymerase sigma-70 factor, ECF subfamily
LNFRIALGNEYAVSLDEPALDEFYAGNRAALERCYREHFADVLRAVGRFLSAADAETVTHEVFYRLLSNEALRRNFHGGNFGAWLRQVAVNEARDHLRRHRRESSDDGVEAASTEQRAESASASDEIEAKMLIDRFVRERLPASWSGVFQERFLRQRSQRDAARELSMHRTTLVYQEARIRALLRKFLLEERTS